MSMKDKLFFFGWQKYALTIFAIGLVFFMLCGCTQVPQHTPEPRYPEYNKWWTKSTNVNEFTATNSVLGANGFCREVVINRTETILL